MTTQLFPHRPLLALSLLAIAYILLGWYLAAHHIFWLVSITVVMATLIFVWKSNPLLECLAWGLKQEFFATIGISLVFSLLVALILVKPMLLSLVPLPLITLIYALLEMRTAEFKQSEILIWTFIVTGLGLGLGEAIDLFVAPSMRY